MKTVTTDLTLTRRLLAVALFDDPFEMPDELPEDWNAYVRFASAHGVAALLSVALNRIYDRGVEQVLPLKTERQIHVVGVSRHDIFEKYLKVASSVATYLGKGDVKMVIFKGLAYAQYFPEPYLRASSDIDCSFLDDFEKGNSLIEAKGVKVDRSYYKHSNFKVGGIEIENHRYCTSWRGSKKAEALEKCLEELLKEGPMSAIGDTKLLSPSPLFNALFLMEHARNHFLREGLALRHFIDWVMLRNALKDKFDYPRFNSLLEEHGLKDFADTFTAVSDYIVGRDVTLDRNTERMLADTLSPHMKIEYKKGLKTSFQIVRNTLSSAWRYRLYSEYSALGWVVRSTLQKYFDRNPEL